jgi:hypothetical protein
MWQFILARAALSLLFLGLGFIAVLQIGLLFALGSSRQDRITWAILILCGTAILLVWTAYGQFGVGIVAAVLVLIQIMLLFLY